MPYISTRPQPSYPEKTKHEQSPHSQKHANTYDSFSRFLHLVSFFPASLTFITSTPREQGCTAGWAPLPKSQTMLPRPFHLKHIRAGAPHPGMAFFGHVSPRISQLLYFTCFSDASREETAAAHPFGPWRLQRDKPIAEPQTDKVPSRFGRFPFLTYKYVTKFVGGTQIFHEGSFALEVGKNATFDFEAVQRIATTKTTCSKTLRVDGHLPPSYRAAPRVGRLKL